MSHVKIDASGILPLIARIGPSNQKMMNIVATQVAKDIPESVKLKRKPFSISSFLCS